MPGRHAEPRLSAATEVMQDASGIGRATGFAYDRARRRVTFRQHDRSSFREKTIGELDNGDFGGMLHPVRFGRPSLTSSVRSAVSERSASEHQV